MFKNIVRKVRHYFGCNTGKIKTFWVGKHLMVGFECACCGEIMGVHEASIRSYKVDDHV